MHDHRTDGGPSADDPRDLTERQAAAFRADVDEWLASITAELEPVDGAAASRRAWSIVADGCEQALELAGLAPEPAAELANLYAHAAQLAERQPIPELLARRFTPEQQARAAWFAEHGPIARAPGGVLLWEACPLHLRAILYAAGVVTVQEVREMAADGTLYDVPNMKPSRVREVMVALRAQ